MVELLYTMTEQWVAVRAWSRNPTEKALAASKHVKPVHVACMYRLITSRYICMTSSCFDALSYGLGLSYPGRSPKLVMSKFCLVWELTSCLTRVGVHRSGDSEYLP